jgi:hypothetical protein
MVAHRRRDAQHTRHALFVVDSVTAHRHASEFRSQPVGVGNRLRGQGFERRPSQQLIQALRRDICEQRLAERGAVGRMTRVRQRLDAELVLAMGNRDIEHLTFVEHADARRFIDPCSQRLDGRVCKARNRDPTDEALAQLESSRTDLVATIIDEADHAPQPQGFKHSERRGRVHADLAGDGGQRHWLARLAKLGQDVESPDDRANHVAIACAL